MTMASRMHRERQAGVGGAHQEGVEPAALVAGDHGDGDADDAGDEHDGERHEQRHAGAVDQAAEHVAAEVVGAEDVVRRAAGEPRRLQAVGQVELLRVVRREQPGRRAPAMTNTTQDGAGEPRQVAPAAPAPRPDRVLGGSSAGSAVPIPDRSSTCSGNATGGPPHSGVEQAVGQVDDQQQEHEERAC